MRFLLFWALCWGKWIVSKWHGYPLKKPFADKLALAHSKQSRLWSVVFYTLLLNLQNSFTCCLLFLSHWRRSPCGTYSMISIIGSDLSQYPIMLSTFLWLPIRCINEISLWNWSFSSVPALSKREYNKTEKTISLVYLTKGYLCPFIAESGLSRFSSLTGMRRLRRR